MSKGSFGCSHVRANALGAGGRAQSHLVVYEKAFFAIKVHNTSLVDLRRGYGFCISPCVKVAGWGFVYENEKVLRLFLWEQSPKSVALLGLPLFFHSICLVSCRDSVCISVFHYLRVAHHRLGIGKEKAAE